jgi:uncharacterized protein
LTITLAQAGALFLAAILAGMVNSVAGGGTLFTFPTLLAIGVPPLAANGTSTVALVPGSAAAVWGYRRELRGRRRVVLLLVVPSLVGGAFGAWLTLRAGDELFGFLVPWLILAATVLFLVQERVAARLPLGEKPLGAARLTAVLMFMTAVATYGGFFGAGMGILILAALAQVGFSDVHEMNAFKNVIAVGINGMATVTFILGDKVVWPLAGVMAGGAIVGGYGGASLARRLGQRRVRQIIVLVGFGIAALMFARRL